MLVEVTGIVVSEETMPNDRKLISILTEDRGIVNCFIGVDKAESARFAAATSILSYSSFTLYKGRSGYRLNDAMTMKMFYGITAFLEKLYLVYYFNELVKYIVMEEDGDEEFLRLMLNSLYVLDNDKKPLLVVKAVFELRLMAIAGYMPDVLACRGCGAYEADEFYFDYDNSCLWCSYCCSAENTARIHKETLRGLRTVMLSEHKKIFSFSLSKNGIAELANLSENYMYKVTEKQFKSLEIFKKICDMEKKE